MKAFRRIIAVSTIAVLAGGILTGCSGAQDETEGSPLEHYSENLTDVAQGYHIGLFEATEKVAIFEEGNIDSPTIGHAEEGERYRIVDVDNGMVKIDLGNGSYGWVLESGGKTALNQESAEVTETAETADGTESAGTEETSETEESAE